MGRHFIFGWGMFIPHDIIVDGEGEFFVSKIRSTTIKVV